MNEVMAISRDWGIASAREALTLPGSISAGAARQLPADVEVLMKTTHGLLENYIVSAIEKRTASDFIRWRDDSFPQYFNAVLGLSALIMFVVPQQVIERINREFFCELESDFRDKGLAAFGADVRDQGLFTAWTLRKISDLVAQFPSVPKLDAAETATVCEMGNGLIFHAIRTRFHLHCLVTSMRLNKAIYPEPLEVMIDGLRSAVNAYSLARQCLDILAPLPEPKPESADWDEEDIGLLREAGRDMLPSEIS